MEFEKLIIAINETVTEFFENSNTVEVSAAECGLDKRAGNLFVSTKGGFIAARYPNSLEYYGGFEYISSEFRERIGDFTFYFDGSSRVDEAIEFYKHNNQQGE